ncbi:CHRD domain-containing protein [Rubrobacter tropicus]|uniref:CHRD domain-containing protein n=1 Tax=Rubrobacter tropicus TaxID=2653851 RepID=A0A6G8Q5T7_9ACTN|nr:CHRD domain-containing protein [Rubrobacter tropicus]QIN81789.1 CHRD domain-containing protein [Rubrobacter tropicus]
MGKRLSVAVAAAVVAAMMLAGPVLAAPVVTLEATLTGEQEVPGPGDRNGRGDAKLIVNRARVCYVLRSDNIKRPQAAHIHEGRRGVAGDIVVELRPPRNGFSSGCEKISRALSRDLRNNPTHYYVNVHNKRFPDGAIRGQLHQ